jgi:hypothetical protein
VGVNFIPVVPFLGDDEKNMDEMVSGAKEAGADFILFGGGMTMRDNQAAWFMKRLNQEFPHLVEKYEQLYQGRYSPREGYRGRYEPSRGYLRQVHRRMLGLCEKYGLKYDLKPSDLAVQVYPWSTEAKAADRQLATDVCIVGAGSAGIGAAIAAARKGAKVVLVERQKRIGGTGVNALVSCWEPGPGCSIAREIFNRMSDLPDAIGVARRFPNTAHSFPLGQWYVTTDGAYDQTLRRAGVPIDQLRNVPYDPEAFDRTTRVMLGETGCHEDVLGQPV